MSIVTSCSFYFKRCFQNIDCNNIFSPEIHYKALQKECKGNKDNVQQTNVYWAF